MCWWMGAMPPAISSTLRSRTAVRLLHCFIYLCELTPHWDSRPPPKGGPQMFSVFSKFKYPALLVSQVFASQRLKAAGHGNQYRVTGSFYEIVPGLEGVKGYLTLTENSERGGPVLCSKMCCLKTIESCSWEFLFLSNFALIFHVKGIQFTTCSE